MRQVVPVHDGHGLDGLDLAFLKLLPCPEAFVWVMTARVRLLPCVIVELT